MVMETIQKAGYQNEVTVKAASGDVGAPAASVGRVAAAAVEAADLYASDEVEKHARYIADAWEVVLKEQTKVYTRQLRQLSNGLGTEAAEPITLHPLPYQWWNLLLAGPFQSIAALGPFLPHKIIRHDEPAFMIAALWRNPAPIPPGFGNPSAAQIMAPYDFRIHLETCNLTACVNGPDFGPIDGVFGGGFINTFTVPINFAQPQQGRPTLYEMNMVVDILGPGVGLPPFAGFATWVLDPDLEPPFFFPFIPGVGPVFIPGVGPRLQHDTPARFAVYI